MEAAVKVAADVHVGMPPGPLSGWIMREVRFHGFAGLPTTHDEVVLSPEFSCFGHHWALGIYPGGHIESEEGYVSAYLVNESPESIQAQYKLVLKHPTNQAQRSFEANFEMMTFEAKGTIGDDWGETDFARRETMLTYLNNGTLTLEVHLRTNKQTEPASLIPSNPFFNNMLKGFNNEEMSDVAFEVGGQLVTSATTFHASHVILRLNAPSLANMCRPGEETTVPINGVEPEVFKVLLYFCYGGTIEEEELAASAKAIIEAADRFEIVNLKLQAEAVLTKQTEITVENMMDNLLYTNSKNLALFQEKIMDFVAENGEKIVGNVSFSTVPGELMSDLLTATTRGKKTTDGASGDALKFMRVVELRKNLHDKGLCIDGTREAMIALLEENLTSNESDAK